MNRTSILEWTVIGSHTIFACALLASNSKFQRCCPLASLVIALSFSGFHAWCCSGHFFSGEVQVLTLSRAVGETLALCTLLLSRHTKGSLRFLLYAGLLEAFIVVSICLGCRILDGLFCLLLISIQRLSSSWLTLADKHKSAVCASIFE